MSKFPEGRLSYFKNDPEDVRRVEELLCLDEGTRNFYACRCYMNDPGVECENCKALRLAREG